MEVSARAQADEIEATSFKTQHGRAAKICDDATSSANEKGRKAKTLEFCISSFQNELGSLVQKKSIGCNTGTVDHESADVNNKMNDFVDGLRRDTFDS